MNKAWILTKKEVERFWLSAFWCFMPAKHFSFTMRVNQSITYLKTNWLVSKIPRKGKMRVLNENFEGERKLRNNSLSIQ